MTEPNLAVIALARTCKDRQTAQTVAENWKLSNAEVKELLWVIDVRDLAIDFEWCKKQIVATQLDRQWVYDLLQSNEQYDILEQVRQWETPVFPINGNDLIQLGYKPGPDLGYELNRRKQWWINSDCKMSRDMLLSYI